MRIERESRESDISASYASSLDSFACSYLRSFTFFSIPPQRTRGFILAPSGRTMSKVCNRTTVLRSFFSFFKHNSLSSFLCPVSQRLVCTAATNNTEDLVGNIPLPSFVLSQMEEVVELEWMRLPF